MQPTASNQQRTYTCWLHGHAKHAMQCLDLKCHAMQQLRAGCASMRVLFFGPNPLSTRFDRASATALKGSKGVCAGTCFEVRIVRNFEISKYFDGLF